VWLSGKSVKLGSGILMYLNIYDPVCYIWDVHIWAYDTTDIPESVTTHRQHTAHAPFSREMKLDGVLEFNHDQSNHPKGLHRPDGNRHFHSFMKHYIIRAEHGKSFLLSLLLHSSPDMNQSIHTIHTKISSGPKRGWASMKLVSEGRNQRSGHWWCTAIYDLIGTRDLRKRDNLSQWWATSKYAQISH
jgi:hypothetical protein